jgi:hypothetical protein
MVGLSPALLDEIREALLECDPMESNRDLRHLFNDDRLSNWRYGIPEADNLLNRVGAITTYLLDSNSDKENGLALFLRVLSEQRGINSPQRLVELAGRVTQDLQHSALKRVVREALNRMETDEKRRRALTDPSIRQWNLDRFCIQKPDRFDCDIDAMITFLRDKKSQDGTSAFVLLLRALDENLDAHDCSVTHGHLVDWINKLTYDIGPDEGAVDDVQEHAQHVALRSVKPPPENYTELEIYISASDMQGAYAVKAELNRDVPFHGTFNLGDIKSTLANVESDAEEYGATLFKALFRERIRGAYDQALAYARAQTEGRVRLRLRIDNTVSELHALIWERLHTEASPMTIAAKSPFSRYIDRETGKSDSITTEPIRILFAMANPEDLAHYKLSPVHIETEVSNMLDVLTDRPSNLQVTLMPGRTGLTEALRTAWEAGGGQIIDDVPTSLDHLVRALSRDGGYHILHYLGHGMLQREQVGLFMENEEGQIHIVKDQDIASRLLALDTLPHLIFLATCDSAKREPGNPNPFVGLAPKLIRVGVPAVIAMQDKIAVPTARTLTRHFYGQLLDHGIVDKALNQARSFIYGSDSTAWSIPVLFMQLKDGILFDIK